MEQPKKPKKHHYLPRAAYLSHFQREEKEGEIYQYMRNGDVLPVNLLDAGAQNHLYTTTIEDKKNYDIEEELRGQVFILHFTFMLNMFKLSSWQGHFA